MNVLPLIKEFCPNSLHIIPDKEISNGADGQIFTIKGEPDKVIKLSVIYDVQNKNPVNQYDKLTNVLYWVSKNKPHAYVNVYTYACMGGYSRPLLHWNNGRQHFILHYYTMERLNKISEDESKIFHSLLSHEDANIVKEYSMPKIEKMLNGMKLGLDFNQHEVKLFINDIRSIPIVQSDLHVRNIMKNKAGQFKIIDLDRCYLTI